MSRIKIAQIGINQYSHSNEILQSISKQDSLFELVGCVFPEGEKERLPNKYARISDCPELTLEAVLNDPQVEAVTVETDEIHLTKYALMAAKTGKHIHMEKPGGINLHTFEELIETVKQTGKVLHLGYMYRYNPYVMDLLEQVKRGRLGQILSVEAQMSCFHPDTLRQWLRTYPGGMMFYLGCHMIDLILQIQGQPKQIIPLNKSTNCNTDAQDFGMAVFEYDNGISFAKVSAMEMGGPARRQLVVSGTNGTVELKPLEWHVIGSGYYTQKTEYTETIWGTTGQQHKSPFFDRYDGMMEAFAAYVRGEKTNPYTIGTIEWE